MTISTKTDLKGSILLKEKNVPVTLCKCSELDINRTTNINEKLGQSC